MIMKLLLTRNTGELSTARALQDKSMKVLWTDAALMPAIDSGPQVVIPKLVGCQFRFRIWS